MASNNALAKEKTSCGRAEEALRARREEILDAATELFAEHGYSDAVTQALAERLRVGKGTLYRCFPSKRELFLAAVDRVMRRLRETARRERRRASTTRSNGSAQAVRAFLDVLRRAPEYVELLIQERALFKDRTKPTYFEHRERNVVRWREHLPRPDRRGPGPRHPRRADHRRDRRPALRHDLHQLLHRPPRKRPRRRRGTSSTSSSAAS